MLQRKASGRAVQKSINSNMNITTAYKGKNKVDEVKHEHPVLATMIITETGFRRRHKLKKYMFFLHCVTVPLDTD